MPTTKLDILREKLNSLKDDSELEALLNESQDDEEPSNDQEEEDPNDKKIKELEALVQQLQQELAKYKSNDAITRAVKISHPHLDISNLTYDAICAIYNADAKEGNLKDEKAMYDEIVRQNKILIKDQIERLTHDLIEATKGSRKPHTIDSVQELIKTWKKTHGITDDFHIIDYLKQEIEKVLSYLPETTADSLKQKFGLPNFSIEFTKDEVPYNSSSLYSPTGDPNVRQKKRGE